MTHNDELAKWIINVGVMPTKSPSAPPMLATFKARPQTLPLIVVHPKYLKSNAPVNAQRVGPRPCRTAGTPPCTIITLTAASWQCCIIPEQRRRAGQSDAAAADV